MNEESGEPHVVIVAFQDETELLILRPGAGPLAECEDDEFDAQEIAPLVAAAERQEQKRGGQEDGQTARTVGARGRRRV